jgi:hypothetical protein
MDQRTHDDLRELERLKIEYQALVNRLDHIRNKEEEVVSRLIIRMEEEGKNE